MSDKKPRKRKDPGLEVTLNHFQEDYLDLERIWIGPDGLTELREIHQDAKEIFEKHSGARIKIDVAEYVTFPRKNKDEEEQTISIDVEITQEDGCWLTITNGHSEAFGGFLL